MLKFLSSCGIVSAMKGPEFGGEKEGIEQTRKRVAALIEELRAAGHELELEETADNFVVGLKDRKLVFPKWEKVPARRHEKDETVLIPLEDLIRARVEHPEEDLFDALGK